MATATPISAAKLFDASQVGSYWTFDVRQALAASIDGRAVSGTWSAGVLTVEWSNDGTTWNGFASAKTLTNAAPSLLEFSVAGISFLRVRVSTAEAGVWINVAVTAKGES